ncbi:sulfite exporter TauE/SafE family protein [Sporosarcina sp. Marseille-Q4063]|uniref:sulfite exporter TauE/SafE family protein n=1 Tax=Sporosarcina sp. Marseille-Q4063 TaxID=2810514 RepID=UPI0035302FEE
MALIASVVGATAGLGGGVIIKPVLDLLHHFDLASIGVLSSFTVLSMAIVTLVKAFRNNIKPDSKTSILIAAGSILGGMSGRYLFNHLITVMENEQLLALIQSYILACILLLIYLFVRYKHNWKTLVIKRKIIILIVGYSLGVISAFLGIGGGPLNVAFLYLLFSMDARNAMINSTFIILFSQASNLLSITFTTGFGSYNLSMLPFMVLGGVLGGLAGSQLAIKFNNKQIEVIFNALMIIILLINIYNIIRFYV